MHIRNLQQRPLIAVLIDAGNVSATHAEAIISEVKTIGDPALRRVYGDWKGTELAGWHSKLSTLGLVGIQACENANGKNAADIKLAIDAMDLLHNGGFDGFVIASSDSDFTPLANRIREAGKFIISIGESKTPHSLRNMADRFILIEPSPAKPNTPKPEQPCQQKQKRAYAIILEAMKQTCDDNGWYGLSPLGKSIRAVRPDFTLKAHGAATLSKLVQKIPELEYRQHGNGQVKLKQ